MYVAYIDDTKQDGKKEGIGHLVAYGAVVFPEDEIRQFSLDFWGIYDKLDIPHDAEMKWSVRHEWFKDPSNVHARHALYEQVLQSAKVHHAEASVVVWDESAVPDHHGKTAEVATVEWLVERIVISASTRDETIPKNVFLVFDEVSGQRRQDHDWIESKRKLIQEGTSYVDNSPVVSVPLTAPSYLFPPLQLADFVAGCITARVSGNQFSEDLYPLIFPILQKSSTTQEVFGSGVKLHPLSLKHYSLPKQEWNTVS